jgi:3-hydroxyisobutyrate dehydrogenase
MVPTGKHVQEVHVGKGKSVLKALESMNQDQRAEALCIDQSTIEQSVSKAVALQLREAGADLVDAPVSGGKPSVLAIMIINSQVHRCCRCREGHFGNHGRRIQDLLR